MTSPVDDPNSYPAAFDVYVAAVGTPLPGNAVDALNSALVLVGQVDGKTLYDHAGRENPFPVVWNAGPTSPFADGTAYAVAFDGKTPPGGQMRACAADVTFSADASGNVTGSAVGDGEGFTVYWYYEPPAA